MIEQLKSDMRVRWNESEWGGTHPPPENIPVGEQFGTIGQIATNDKGKEIVSVQLDRGGRMVMLVEFAMKKLSLASEQ